MPQSFENLYDGITRRIGDTMVYTQHPFSQRDELVAMLTALTPAQWAAQTLCDGWNAKDLVAHLIVRERNPLAAIGLIFPPFKPIHDRAMDRLATRSPKELLRALRAGPPWWARIGQIDLAEDWIHTQDIIRGHANEADPTNELTPDSGDEHPFLVVALGRACDRFAPFVLRQVPGPFRLMLTDQHLWLRTWLVRPQNQTAIRAANANIAPDVTVTGSIGEVLLYLTGRGPHARVTLTGDPTLIHALDRNLSGI